MPAPVRLIAPSVVRVLPAVMETVGLLAAVIAPVLTVPPTLTVRFLAPRVVVAPVAV